MDKVATIRDIAEALGVSIGTVDRALNDRPGVNPMTKARVLQMANTLGYRPNLAARFLSSKRRVRISVNIPAEIASFWNVVRNGIEDEASSPTTAGLEVEYRIFPRFGCDEEKAFEDALKAGVDGIIASTGRPDSLRALIRKASRSRIPVVCVATDAPGSERLGVVSVDPLVSGSLAGELLGRFNAGKGELAVVTGDLQIVDHSEKHRAFGNAVSSLFPSIRVLPPIENHEDETEAYDKCRALLRDHPNLVGIYVSTANSNPVLQAVDEAGKVGKLSVVTTDLFARLTQRIKAGQVVATLYQRPKTQGRLALRMLHTFLVEGRCPSHRVHLAPHLVMRSNLPFFLQQVPAEDVLNGETDRNGTASAQSAVSSS